MTIRDAWFDPMGSPERWLILNYFGADGICSVASSATRIAVISGHLT
jgi:hypothetical protein